MTLDHLKDIFQSLFGFPRENLESLRVLSSYQTASHDIMVTVCFLDRYRLLFIDKEETSIKPMNSGMDIIADDAFKIYAQEIAQLIGATLLEKENC